MIKKYSNRGFTLIELLVVIAIIGILSSVVLASLSTARNKAKDAGIRSQMSSLRTQAEIYYSDHSNSYGTAGTDCAAAVFSDSQIGVLKSKIETDSGHTMACNNTTSDWAAQIQLSGTSGVYVCVDSSGKVSDKSSAHTITDQACD
jgi:prepilin-type N-terminal cleavage/methylation domain-containing protein